MNQRNPAAETVFYTDLSPYYKLVGKICIQFAAVLLILGFIRQFGSENTDYSLVAIAPLVAIGMFIVLVIFLVALRAYFKVYISSNYIHCYTSTGRYLTASWQKIESAEISEVSGMPYIYLGISGLSSQLTIPVWLDNMAQFKVQVSGYAGASHPLSELLSETAT